MAKYDDFTDPDQLLAIWYLKYQAAFPGRTIPASKLDDFDRRSPARLEGLRRTIEKIDASYPAARNLSLAYVFTARRGATWREIIQAPVVQTTPWASRRPSDRYDRLDREALKESIREGYPYLGDDDRTRVKDILMTDRSDNGFRTALRYIDRADYIPMLPSAKPDDKYNPMRPTRASSPGIDPFLDSERYKPDTMLAGIGASFSKRPTPLVYDEDLTDKIRDLGLEPRGPLGIPPPGYPGSPGTLIPSMFAKPAPAAARSAQSQSPGTLVPSSFAK